MQLIIVSGRSGSGKSVALHMLEDLGFYCVDGVPTTLLPNLVEELSQGYNKVATSIDARNFPRDFSKFKKVLANVKDLCESCEIIYLNADDNTLIKRFSETRRKHPLTTDDISLDEALQREHELLHPLQKIADTEIETNQLSVHELRNNIRSTINNDQLPSLSILFLSFGFKHGLPLESDYVFDVRCLPNPYWEPELRQYTGLDPAIKQYLETGEETPAMVSDITNFLDLWLPHYEKNNRQYLTIALGCTGGQHRSVYVAEKLAAHYQQHRKHIQVRHRDLS